MRCIGLIGLQLADSLSHLFALLWGALLLQEIGCMQQILRSLGFVSPLAAAESPGDPTHGLIRIRLDRFSKQAFSLWPSAGLRFIHPCVM